MARLEELRERAASFRLESRERHRRAMSLLKQFHERFPFHKNPEAIDHLTEEDLYSPGTGDYFFYWVERRLRDLGAIAVGSTKPYVNASENLEKFRELLRITVDDKKSLAEKVDADWHRIKGFGGDRHIAKKIIYLYNPDRAFPIFKSEDLKQFVEELGRKPESESLVRLKKPYEQLSVGERWQLLTELLSEIRDTFEELRNLDNLEFGYLLYGEIEPKSPRFSQLGTVASTPMSGCGLLFEPRTEAELLLLFGMYHQELGFPYILAARSTFPDVIAIDGAGEVKRIEFELNSSTFQAHGHSQEDCDYIICWNDDWDAPEEVAEKIISLKDKIKDIIASQPKT